MEPFLEAIENMTEYYVHRGIDVFKQAISGSNFGLDLKIFNLQISIAYGEQN